MSSADIPVGQARSPAPPGPDPDALTRAWTTPSGFAALSAVNQKPIGRRYIITAFTFFLIGGMMALLMRTQLAVPQNDFMSHELYNQLFTMHGTTMMFLFAVPILEGAAIYLIPLMIGSRDMAFPRLSAFGYWCYLLGGLLLYSSLFLLMMPDGGWFMYPPLTSPEFSPAKNNDFWLLGITLVEIGGIVAAAEIAVSILKTRAPGMSLDRMPLFAWYMLVVSFMILFGFPPLILGDLLLEIERSFDWPFFDPSRGGHPLLWQHLFWIFGHPEVYIIFLPAAGMVSMMIATFSRRPAVGHSWLVVAAVGTGFVSMGLWVHHMFTTGIPLISLGFFSAASMTVAIFSGIQIFAWLATLWLGRPVFKTPLLFVIGFIFLFVAGGLTGVMHAVIPFDWQTHSTYFLVAHFHYVLFGGMVFPLFGAIYYWFPTVTGRMMSETLGKWNFWLLFIGFNVAFFPMHISGMLGMPRRIYTYPEGLWDWENLTSTIGAYMIAAGVLLFLYNFFRSMRRGAPAGHNPWDGGTLEWAMPLPTPPYNFRSIPVVQSRYPVWEQKDLPREIEAGEHLVPHPERGLRLGVSSSTVKGDSPQIIIQPKPSYSPLVAALGLAAAFAGFLIDTYWLAGLGAGIFVLAILTWLWQQPLADVAGRDRVEKATGLPVGSDVPQGLGWWGTIIAILGDAALFLSLIFAYFYLWSQAPAWPPAGIRPLDLVWSAVGVGGLLVGSLAARLATRTLHRTRLVAVGLLIPALIGAAYMALQLWLLAETGLSPDEHAYNALVFTLVGFHLAHVAVALLMLVFGIAWTLFGVAGLPRSLVVRNTELFWHYTVGMGVIANLVVYLSPHAL